MGVSVLDAEAQVRDSPGAGAVRSEALLFRAEDLPALYIVCGQYDNARGPEFI